MAKRKSAKTHATLYLLKRLGPYQLLLFPWIWDNYLGIYICRHFWQLDGMRAGLKRPYLTRRGPAHKGQAAD